MSRHKKQNKSASKGSNQSFADRRTANPPHGGANPAHADTQGAPFHEQDAERRLGSFEGKGEHARTGNRGHQ